MNELRSNLERVRTRVARFRGIFQTPIGMLNTLVLFHLCFIEILGLIQNYQNNLNNSHMQINTAQEAIEYSRTQNLISENDRNSLLEADIDARIGFNTLETFSDEPNRLFSRDEISSNEIFSRVIDRDYPTLLSRWVESIAQNIR